MEAIYIEGSGKYESDSSVYLQVSDGTLNITGGTFKGTSGTFYITGGGLYAECTDASVPTVLTMTGCTFRENFVSNSKNSDKAKGAQYYIAANVEFTETVGGTPTQLTSPRIQD